MPLRDRALGAFRDLTGLSLVEGEELDKLQESSWRLDSLSADAEDLAFWVEQYWGGRPQEMRPERRRRLARRARTAFLQDPVAGTEAEHYANFSVGRGVSIPQAKDPDVQKVIDRAWKDPNNQDKLTSFDALRALSNELKASSNVYVLLFSGNGRVRVSFLNADAVEEIVTDSVNDRLRPLYYVVRETEQRWDFKSHMWVAAQDALGQLDPTYYAHWRNVDDLNRAAKEIPGLKKPDAPDPKLVGDGTVFHVRNNRLVEQMFGTPQWARTLRYFSALNRLLEARVAMAQAASSLIAKRVVKGGRDDVSRAAAAVLKQTGEIAAGASRRDDVLGLQRPLRPGSIRTENESDTLQAVNLNSGASQAASDIQMVRGAAVSPSAMGQHYFGAADSSNLSTAACHDELTETLTDEGFLTYEQLRRRDADGTLPRIAGFDKESGELVYQRPLRPMLQYDYEGDLVVFKNRRTDIAVTPDHRMWVQRSSGRWDMVEAQEIRSKRAQLRAAPLGDSGLERLDYVEIPEYVIQRQRGPRERWTQEQEDQVKLLAQQLRPASPRRGLCLCGCGKETAVVGRNYYRNGRLTARKGEPSEFHTGHALRPYTQPQIAKIVGLKVTTVSYIIGHGRRNANAPVAASDVFPAVRVPADAYLYWLGWYLAEGSDASVAQKADGPWAEKLRDACLALGVPGREARKGDMWFWQPRATKQWQVHLDREVGRGFAHKRVPEYVFRLPRDQQMLVLRGMVEGDGTTGGTSKWERSGSVGLGMSNLGLVEDAQRLGLHCGFRADLLQSRFGPAVSLVATAEDTPSGWNGSRSVLPAGKRVPYKGRVYCFTLPTDTMITRRNGRVAFHGNTLELPALMAVNAHQEIIEGILRWFTDRAIEEAARNGELGGVVDDGTEGFARPLSELRLEEAEDRTGKDLSYSFSMPYPGRRDLQQVMAAFTAIMTQLSPLGENDDLLRAMLRYVFTNGFELEDAGELADAVADSQKKLLVEQQRMQQEQQQAMFAQAQQAQIQQGDGSQPGVPTGGGGGSVYGENRGTAQAGGDGYMPAQEGSFVPVDLVPGIEVLLREVRDSLTVGVEEPTVRAIAELNGRVDA